MDIQSLNSDVRANIRSGYSVSNIVHCIKELVLNSLDAHSKHIAVRINLITFRIEVVDDGEGITETNLDHVGKRHYTNKCYSLEDLNKTSNVFGFKGEALASIAANSKLVKITSRCWNCNDTQSLCAKTFLKTIKGKNSSVTETTLRISGGTTITVLDFLCNLPVRQKNTKQIDFNEIRRNLQCIYLMHPGVAISLRDDSSKKILFNSQIVDTIEDAMLQQIENLDKKYIKYYSLKKGHTSVKILIYLKSYENNKYQLFYINRCPVKSALLTNFVNDILRTSTIAGSGKKDRKNAKFLYLINICCPHSKYQLLHFEELEFKRLASLLALIECQFENIFDKENIGIPQVIKKRKKEYSISNQIRLSAFPGAYKATAIRKINVDEECDNLEACAAANLEECVNDSHVTCGVDEGKSLDRDSSACSIIRPNYRNNKQYQEIKTGRYLSASMSSSASLSSKEMENGGGSEVEGLVDPKLGDNLENNSTIGRNYIIRKFLNGLPNERTYFRCIPLQDGENRNISDTCGRKPIPNRRKHQSVYVHYPDYDSRENRNEELYDVSQYANWGDDIDTKYYRNVDSFDQEYPYQYKHTKIYAPYKDNTNNIYEPYRAPNAKVFPSGKNIQNNYFCNLYEDQIYQSNQNKPKMMYNRRMIQNEAIYRPNDNKVNKIPYRHQDRKEKIYPPYDGLTYKFYNRDQNQYDRNLETHKNPKLFEDAIFARHINNPHSPYANIENIDNHDKNQDNFCAWKIPNLPKTSPMTSITKFTFPHRPYESEYISTLNRKMCKDRINYHREKNIARKTNADQNIHQRTRKIPLKQPLCSKSHQNKHAERMKIIQTHVTFPGVDNKNFSPSEQLDRNYFSTPFKDPKISDNNFFCGTGHEYDFTSIPKFETEENPPSKRNVFFRKRASEKSQTINHQHRFGSMIKTSVTYSRITKVSRRIKKCYKKQKNYVLTRNNREYSSTQIDMKQQGNKVIKRISTNAKRRKVVTKIDKATNTLIDREQSENSKYCNNKVRKNVINQSIQCTLMNKGINKATDTNSDFYRNPKEINVISNILIQPPLQDPEISSNNVNDVSELDEIIYSTDESLISNHNLTTIKSHTNNHQLNVLDTLTNKSSNIFGKPKKKYDDDEFKFTPICELQNDKDFTNFKKMGSTNNQEFSEVVANTSMNCITEKPQEKCENVVFAFSPFSDLHLNISDKIGNNNVEDQHGEIDPNNKDKGLFDLSAAIEEIVCVNRLNDNTCNKGNMYNCSFADVFNTAFTSQKSTRDDNGFNEWSRQIDDQGGSYYINKRTGNTMNHKPTDGEIFHFIERPLGIPKCFSPVLIESPTIVESVSSGIKREFHAAVCESYKDDLGRIKWKKHYLQETDPNEFFQRIYDKRFQIDEVADLKLPKPKSTGLLNLLAFTKDMFHHLDIVRQYDHKFIVATWKPNDIVVVFDQHAVHERIRLEQLHKSYRCEGTGIFRAKKLKEFAIKLNRNVVANCQKHSDLYIRFGIEITSIDDNFLKLRSVPACLFNKVLRESSSPFQKLIELTKALLNEIENSLFDAVRSDQWVPPLLINLINSEACRSAIMFGDALTIEECGNLIKELSSCVLPFQCAHGRPTCAPVIKLVRNEEKIAKINLKCLKVSPKES